MANFETAYHLTLTHEGGYVNDPVDRGGETYKGIARKRNPDWQGWKIIDAERALVRFPKRLDDNIALQMVTKDFYRLNYWDKVCGNSLPQSVANEVFDAAVNMGVERAGKFLQGALNILNRNGTLFPDLVEDGQIGQKTLSTLALYLSKDSDALLAKVLNISQGSFYLQIMRADPTQEKFARGWFHRVAL